jgi:transposase
MTSRCPHFLPPYCPDHNRIERCVWRELHANATYNHWCEVIEELVAAAIAYLRRRD